MTKDQTNQENQLATIPDEIICQIFTVRETGKTNMFDIYSVQRIAYELELFALVDFLIDKKNINAYIDFILHRRRLQNK